MRVGGERHPSQRSAKALVRARRENPSRVLVASALPISDENGTLNLLPENDCRLRLVLLFFHVGED